MSKRRGTAWSSVLDVDAAAGRFEVSVDGRGFDAEELPHHDVQENVGLHYGRWLDWFRDGSFRTSSSRTLLPHIRSHIKNTMYIMLNNGYTVEFSCPVAFRSLQSLVWQHWRLSADQRAKAVSPPVAWKLMVGALSSLSGAPRPI